MPKIITVVSEETINKIHKKKISKISNTGPMIQLDWNPKKQIAGHTNTIPYTNPYPNQYDSQYEILKNFMIGTDNRN